MEFSRPFRLNSISFVALHPKKDLLVTALRLLFCIFWSVLMISSSLLLMLLAFNRRIPVVMARTCWAPGILWACGVKVKVEGKEHVVASEPHVYVCNHLSYLDIPVLFRVLPVNLYFVAKKEISWVPFIGWYMAATGMIFIDRGNRARAIESLARAGKLIKGGKNVLMFPEGTRSRHGEVGEFKKGPFMLAAQAEVGVVPVALNGTGSIWKAGTFSIRPGEVKVGIGMPVESAKRDLTAVIQEVREQVVVLKEGGVLQPGEAGRGA